MPALSSVDRSTNLDGLTERQIEVLALVARGASNQAIADELVLSVRTVERHLANIYTKLNISRRSQAAVYALSHGLFEVAT